jgi:uncharacterized repeat protein (TIGR01451 family)
MTLIVLFGAATCGPAWSDDQCSQFDTDHIIEVIPANGITKLGTTCKKTNAITSYSSGICHLLDPVYWGNEDIYELRLHEGNAVSFSLKSQTDLVLAVTTKCGADAGSTCRNSSADFMGPKDEEISTTSYKPAGTYYLYIDTFERKEDSNNEQPACGDYELTVNGTNPTPDLLVGLTAPPTVIAGTAMTYTLSVVNRGTLPATNVNVTQTLPKEVSFVSVDRTDECEGKGEQVVCQLQTLNVNDSRVWKIVVNVLPTTRSLSGTADATSDEGDPTRNTVVLSTHVDAQVNLTLDINAPDAILAGRSITYNLTISNHGLSSATALRMTFTPPSNVRQMSPSKGCSIISSDNVVICKISRLDPGHDVTRSVFMTVDPSAQGSLSSITQIESREHDLPLETTNITVLRRANLKLINQTTQTEAIAGGSQTYTFDVENAGPSTATGVFLTDALPTDLMFDKSGSSKECHISSGNTVTCSLGNLDPNIPPGAVPPKSVTINTTVDPAYDAPNVTHQASVAAAEDDINRTNNISKLSTLVTISADLQLTGEGPTTVSGDDLGSLVCAGENLLYTFNVFNDGPSNSRGGTIRGISLGDLSFVSSPDGCIFHGNNGTVSCPVPAMPPKGDPYVARFVAASTKALTTVPIAAIVLSAYDDESGNDGVTLDSLSIDSASDLLASLSGPRLVKPGSALTYTLDVTNRGPSKAEAVTIGYGIEPAIAPITVASEPGCDDTTCTPSSCICSIEADTTQTITISFPAPAGLGTTVTASASVVAANCDPSGNNEDNLSTLVVEDDADLVLKLSADRDVAVEGDLLRYTIDVVNQGFETAPRVTVIDDLPAGVTFVKAEPVEGCNEHAGTVVCGIEAGESLMITVRVNDGSTLENEAHLLGTPDLNEANNQDSLKTLVVKVAPLVLPFFEVSGSPSGLTTLFSVKSPSTSLRVRYTAVFGSDSLFASSDLDDKQTKTVNLIDFGRLLGKSGYVGITPDPNSDDLRHTLTGDFVWSDPLHGSASGERLISTDTSRTPSELCTSWSVRFFRGEPAGASTDLLFFVPGNSNSTEPTEPVATGKVFTESGAFVQNIEIKSAEKAFRLSINTRKDSDLPSLLAGSGSIEWTFRDGLAGHVTAAHRLRGKDEVAIPGFCRTSQTEGASSLILPFFEKSAGITSLLAFRNETDEEIQVQTSYFDETGASAQSQPPPTQLPAHATSIVTLDQAPELPESFTGSVKVTVVPPDDPAPLLGRALSGDYIRGDEHGEVSGSALVDAGSSNQFCQRWDVRFVQGIPAGSETRFLFYLQGSGSPTGTAYKEDGGSLGSVLIPFQLQSFLVPASALGLSGSGSVEWDLGMKGHVAMLFTGKGPGGNYSVLIPGTCRD